MEVFLEELKRNGLSAYWVDTGKEVETVDAWLKEKEGLASKNILTIISNGVSIDIKITNVEVAKEKLGVRKKFEVFTEPFFKRIEIRVQKSEGKEIDSIGFRQGLSAMEIDNEIDGNFEWMEAQLGEVEDANRLQEMFHPGYRTNRVKKEMFTRAKDFLENPLEMEHSKRVYKQLIEAIEKQRNS